MNFFIMNQHYLSEPTIGIIYRIESLDWLGFHKIRNSSFDSTRGRYDERTWQPAG